MRSGFERTNRIKSQSMCPATLRLLWEEGRGNIKSKNPHYHAPHFPEKNPRPFKAGGDKGEIRLPFDCYSGGFSFDESLVNPLDGINHQPKDCQTQQDRHPGVEDLS